MRGVGRRVGHRCRVDRLIASVLRRGLRGVGTRMEGLRSLLILDSGHRASVWGGYFGVSTREQALRY
jgi:hypothetical protein